MRLYEIAEQFRQLDDFIPDIESMEDGQAFTELFDQLQGDLTDKVHGCCCVIRNAQGEAEALAQEIKRMTAKKKALDAKADRVQNYMEMTLRSIGQDKVKTSLFDVSFRKLPGSVLVSDIDALPDGFFKVKKEADKVAIKSAIKEGFSVPGASIETGERLVIK